MKTVVDLVTSLKNYLVGKSSVAPIEADPTDSSASYSIGDQFYISNVLYEAIASISQHDALVVGTNIKLADDLTTQIKSITDMTGATSIANGVHGLVPQPLIADKDKFLKGDGTWGDVSSSISTLTDVNLTTLANKDVLRYNSTSQKWENDQLNDKADKTDLTSTIATGAINTTGAPITDGTYFYKDGVMSRAIADIAENATFTLNTNYENVQTGALNDISSKKDTYSTTETKTNKVWINGKPIYRKVIDFGALPNATEKTVNTSISNGEDLVRYSCLGVTSGGTYLQIPYASLNSLSDQIHCNVKLSQITITTGIDRSTSTAKVIMEYTKTTD